MQGRGGDGPCIGRVLRGGGHALRGATGLKGRGGDGPCNGQSGERVEPIARTDECRPHRELAERSQVGADRAGSNQLRAKVVVRIAWAHLPD